MTSRIGRAGPAVYPGPPAAAKPYDVGREKRRAQPARSNAGRLGAGLRSGMAGSRAA